MKNPVYFLTIIFLFLTGCSVGNIDISKKEVTETTIHQPELQPDDITSPGSSTVQGETNAVPEIPYSDVPKKAELGERFCVIGPVNSGHLYLTINRCEVFDSLNDAGIKFDDTMQVLIADGFNYDACTTEFLKDFKMIKIYMTLENVDAVSYDHMYMPDEYDKYDFSMGRIGGISYATGEYFDLHPDEGDYMKLHIEPNESKEIVMGYLLDTRKAALEDAVFSNGDEINTPEGIPYTVVNLRIGSEV